MFDQLSGNTSQIYGDGNHVQQYGQGNVSAIFGNVNRTGQLGSGNRSQTKGDDNLVEHTGKRNTSHMEHAYVEWVTKLSGRNLYSSPDGPEPDIQGTDHFPFVWTGTWGY